MTVCVPSQQVDEVITNLTGDDMWDEDNGDILESDDLLMAAIRS
jgi:hypothetical protein